jgi:hypothetical protein
MRSFSDAYILFVISSSQLHLCKPVCNSIFSIHLYVRNFLRILYKLNRVIRKLLAVKRKAIFKLDIKCLARGFCSAVLSTFRNPNSHFELRLFICFESKVQSHSYRPTFSALDPDMLVVSKKSSYGLRTLRKADFTELRTRPSSPRSRANGHV